MASLISKLSALRECVPIAELGLNLDQPVSGLPLIGESPHALHRFEVQPWYKVEPSLYVRVRDGNFDQFAWATSDGVFAYVMSGDTYFDDGAAGRPPNEMLPDGRSFTWPDVVKVGRQSGDHFEDYDCKSHRVVCFGRFYFFYPHATPSPTDAPILIKIVPEKPVRYIC